MSIHRPTTDHVLIRTWCEKNKMVPAELLPLRLDHVPATLTIVPAASLKPGEPIGQISWEEFFLKFDELSLAFVFDDDSGSYHEIVQDEARLPRSTTSLLQPEPDPE